MRLTSDTGFHPQLCDNTNIFVGIASVDLTGPVALQSGKKKFAETMAIKNVAMSLVGDLETYREASGSMKVYKDDSAETKKSLVDNIKAKVDMNLKGCMAIMPGKTIKHPISKRKTYVAAYYVDPALSADAPEFLKSSYADMVRVTKHTQTERGKHAGMQDALNTARQSKAEYNRGRTEGRAAVDKAVAEREAAERAARERSKGAAGSGKGGSSYAPVKAQGGTYSGGTIDTDF